MSQTAEVTGKIHLPPQGTLLHADVQAQDGDSWVNGIVVRDDIEAPGLTVLKLNDGRYLLGTECKYRLTPETATPT